MSASAAIASLAALLAPGVLVFTASAAIPLALERADPTLAGYAALFPPVLFGFAAAWFWSRMKLIIAGFMAVAGALGSSAATDGVAGGQILEFVTIFGRPAAAYLAWLVVVVIGKRMGSF